MTTKLTLKQEIIDIVFPGMKEPELLKWVETDFESFWKEWRIQPGTAANLELITELQALYPEKFTQEVIRAINVPLERRETYLRARPTTQEALIAAGIYPPAEIPLPLDEAMTRAVVEPIYLTAEALVGEDFYLPEAWQLKLMPDDSDLGFTQSLITPEGEEIAFEDVFEVEGVWMTRAQMEALEVPEVETPEFAALTSDYQLIYKDYLRTGGTFGVEAWQLIGAPLRPAETDIDTLLDETYKVGRTPETEALLRRMAPNITEEDIEGFFAPMVERPVPSLFRVPGVRTLEERISIMRIAGVPEDEIEKIIELSKLDLGAEGWLQKFKDINPSFAKDFLNSLPMRSISAGYGDLVSGLAGVAGWAGNEQLRENLMAIAESFHIVAPPVEEWDVSLKTVLDPRFWATTVARALPFSVAMIPISLMTFGTGSAALAAAGVGVWKAHIIAAIFGGVSGAILESSFEAGSVWNEAKNMGWSDEDADKAARSTFTKGVFALTGTNAIQLFAMFLPDPTRILNNLVGKGLVTVVRVGGKIVTVSLTEGGEEAIQNVIERQALGLEVEWDDEMKMQFMIGAIMGLGMGGAADVLTTITDRVSSQLPTDIKPDFDATVDGLKADGASDMQAKVQVLDMIGDNKEVQDITDRVVEEVIKEENIKSVKPEDKADALAWEHIVEPEAKPPMPVSDIARLLGEAGTGKPGLSTERMGLVYRDPQGNPVGLVTLHAEPDGTIRLGTVINEATGLLKGKVTRAFVAELGKMEVTMPPVSEMSAEGRALYEKYQERLKVPAVPEVILDVKGLKVIEDRLGMEVVDRFKLDPKRPASFDEAVERLLAHKEEIIPPESEQNFINAIRSLQDEAGIETAKFKPIPKPPAVEVAKPPVAPEVLAERAITDDQTERINTLAKEKLIMTEEGKTKPQLRRLMTALTGKNRINRLTQGEADLMIEAVGRLEVKYGRPPVIPTGVGLITAEFADKIPLLKEIGILEKVRPTRHVFEKMGLRQEVWKPAFEAEVLVYEEHQAFDKELNRIGKLVGKDSARRQLVFREIENPGSQVGLTFNEKRAVTWFRKYFDDWANRLNLPENKRRTNYVTHIFEEEISQQLKEKHPIDPELIKALDFITPKTVFNPYLQKRLGQTIGLREDPFAAATAYEARALKVFYYEPLIQRIRVYQKYLPPHSAKYLSDFIKRITNRPLTIDRELNQTVKEFGNKIRGLPGGDALADSLTRGNPGGMASYNLTSVLYTLWLGFKPTSAIRNLGQHSLIIAETGIVNFSRGMTLRLTAEGRAALKESLVLRSRRGAFIPAIDSSFASKWSDSFREKALWMFRFADKQNVSDAFLSGYAEAKDLFPNAPRELWVNRGDEVAADTQYLYTKFNSFAMSQNSIGRVFSMLTTWTENWMELMTKWIGVKPSQVFLAYTKETGQAMPRKNWSQTRKAILMYMLIVGLGYALKEKTRLKAWEYVGITSLRYLSDIVGGDFPALQAPGAVADLIIGFITDDERRLKTGWNAMKSTFIPSIIKQMNYVAEGERDWLTLLLYLEGKNIVIKRLKEKWEKDFREYEELPPAERTKYREDNPLIEAKQFVVGQFTTLSSDEARVEALRLIEEHKLDTELIPGYEKVFGVDTKVELDDFQERIGTLEKLVAGEEAEYFTTSNFASEVNRLVKIMGRAKVEQDGNKLAIEYLHAKDLFEVYEALEEADARTLWRQQYPDVEALLYLFGKVSSFKNPKSAEILLDLMKKYDIPPEAIRAFIDKPERYDELLTPVFELKQKTYDLSTEYENYGNPESVTYILDDDARAEARDKLKADNPEWVADLRRIEAMETEAPENIVEQWVELGKITDEFGANSAEVKLFRLEHGELTNWAMENQGWTGNVGFRGMEYYRLQIKWREAEEEYEVIEDTEERVRYLEAHPDFRDDRRRMDAMEHEIPENLIKDYVEYYQLERKGYEDDWFLMEHKVFYDIMIDKELWKPRDFSKVPTREVFALYQEWQGMPLGTARREFEALHPDLDRWLHIKYGTKLESER